MTKTFALLAAALVCAPTLAPAQPTASYVLRQALTGLGVKPDNGTYCEVAMTNGSAGKAWHLVFVGQTYNFLTAQKDAPIIGAPQATSLIADAENGFGQESKTCEMRADGFRINYLWVDARGGMHPLRTMCGPGLRDGAGSAAGTLLSRMVDGWCGAPASRRD